MAKLESLIVDVQLETAELRKGLEELKEQFKEAGEATEGLFEFEQLKEIGHLAYEAAEKLADFALEGGEAADRMGKLAAAAQVPVEQFARFAYTARLSGLSAEDLGSSFSRLNRTLAEAASGSKTQQALFQAMGVSLKDSAGVARGSGDVFKELAVKVNGLAPGFAKSRLEQELFGKSGAQLDVTLKDVAEGMADVGGEADAYAKAVAAAAGPATEFNDNVQRVKVAVEGVAIQVAANLAPAMKKMTDEFVHSKSGAEALKDAVAGITFVLKALVSVAVAVAAAFEYVATALAGGVASALAAMSGDFDGANAIVKDMKKELGSIVDVAGNRFKTIWDDSKEAIKEVGEQHGKTADKILADQKRLEEAEADRIRQLEFQLKLNKLLFEEHVAGVESEDKAAAIRAQGATATQAFQNIGRPDLDVLKEATGKFKDFDAAMSNYVAAQLDINRQQLVAAEAKKSLDEAGYDEAMEVIRSDEKLAERAKKAADAFSAIKTDAAKQAENNLNAVKSLTASLFSKMGDFGTTLNAGLQGFQMGGIWGALIAVIIELFSKFEGFGKLIEQGNSIIKNLIDSLSPGFSALAGGLHTFMDGVGKVLNVIGALLNGPLKGVAIAFDNVGRLISAIFDGIGPALTAIGDMVSVVSDVISALSVLDPTMKLLGALFKLVGVGMSYLNYGIMKALGWIFEKVRELLSMIGLNDLAMTISKLAITMNAKAEAVKAQADQSWSELGHTFDNFFGGTTEVGEIKRGAPHFFKGLDTLGEAATKTAKEVTKLAEAFTNVPEGFRIRLRTFQATGVAGGATDFRGGGDTYQFNFGGSLLSEKSLMQLYDNFKKQQTFNRRGRGGR